MVLFEADEDESDGEDSPEGSPKMDERYFRPSAVTTPGLDHIIIIQKTLYKSSLISASCVDLISFESPRLIKEQ